MIDGRTRTRARSRTDTGWYLVGQLCLMWAALLWGPFGARDAAEVSDVLPALHPALFETPATVAQARVEDERGPAPIVRAIVAAAAVVLAVVRPRHRSSLCRRPVAVDLPRQVSILDPGGCRAPPPSLA